MVIYHGSNSIITKPLIRTTGFYKDFGYGFYCTLIEKQAERWASNKRPQHIVNVYQYTETPDLQSLHFKSSYEL